jgi:hypothetical protein
VRHQDLTGAAEPARRATHDFRNDGTGEWT